MKLHKSLLLFGASALLLTACGEDGGSEETTTDDTETEEVVEDNDEVETENNDNEETSEEAVNSFDGQTIKTKDVTIEIIDYKVLQPGEGNNFGDVPILAFWYDTTVHEDV